MILVLVFYGSTWVSGSLIQASYRPSDSKKGTTDLEEKLHTNGVSILPKDLDINPADLADHFSIRNASIQVTVETSLDPLLQNYISGLLRRSRVLEAAVVVLNPKDGRILAMVSHEKKEYGKNICLKADFPAASLFKIVSAAAAIESAGFTPNRTVFFQGRKHTLYKKQLQNKNGKYTSRTSFRKAFASSINSVFGKLGIYDLGQKILADYADKFFFNRTIPFDLPVSKSTIYVPNDDFGLAEIASGFNKKTLISPLHAALLASAVANDGIVVTPRLVESISDESGKILYMSNESILTSPISRVTAKYLKVLMRDTVLYGTCRKSFLRLRRKKILRDVELGAKTGTINDEMDKLKYEWLTAYAIPTNGKKTMCIAVLAIHGKTLGVRASDLGRYIIKYYLTS